MSEELEYLVSTLKNADNEATSAPYWLILDPQQNMRCDVGVLAHQITGPFFSREDAEKHLTGRYYAFSKSAKVFCMSGYWSYKYHDFCKSIKKV